MPNFTPKYLVIFILWSIMCVNLTYLDSHSSFDNFHQNGKIKKLLHKYTVLCRKVVLQCMSHKYAWRILARLVK